MDHQQAVEQRIQILEDQAAVLQLKYKYLNACDEKNPDAIIACFAAGEIDINFGHIGVFTTREAFVDLYKQMACRESIVDMHHAQNPIIEFADQDSAKAKVGLRFYSLDTDNKTSTQIGGYYQDKYQRISGDWLITSSHFHVTSVELRDFSGATNIVTYIGNSMPA